MSEKSVLLVLTSHSRLDGEGAKTGTWLEELAAAYYPFADAGWRTQIASIAGGDAPIDPTSLSDPWLTETGRRFMADNPAFSGVKGSLSLADVAEKRFDAVYLVGGAGTAWDFPDNAQLARLLQETLAGGGYVGGVCHGVVGLLNKVEGKAIASGLRVTCVSNREEEMAGFDQLVPLLPESALGEAGATVSVGEPFEAHVVTDGRVVTGQNPASAGGVSEEILSLVR